MLYEDQASTFDERAGVPASACTAIADAVAALTGLGPGRRLLEIGVGTGSLSMAFLGRDFDYVGFDRSPAMLAVFRERADAAALRAELHAADGNDRWPAADGSVDAIFASRAIHHLEAGHVVAETLRSLAPSGGWLVLGTIRRPHDSVKSVLRRRMRGMLRDAGITGRSHGERTDAVFAALEREGARPHEPIEAARWITPHSPADSLNSWAAKQGLAGVEVSPELKALLIEELRAWAASEYGNVERPLDQQEFFELAPIEIRRA